MVHVRLSSFYHLLGWSERNRRYHCEGEDEYEIYKDL
jgi:hypothetical protein